MNLRHIVLASLASTTFVNGLNAATVIFCIGRNQDADGNFAPGQFRITAKVSLGDNGGLSGYGIDLTGGILTLDHRSPRDPSAATATQEGPTGFTLGRSADNVVPRFILASQDINNPDAAMVYGFGQQANSFANLGITVGGATLEQPAWDAELLLATGTYSGIAPTFVPFGPNRGVNVFVNSTGRQVQTAQIIYDFCVPEPSTVGLTMAMLLGAPVMRRARRTSFGETDKRIARR